MKKHLVILLGCILGAAAAKAHPHAWITLETTAIINDKNEMTALKQRWTFDEYYTAFLLHDYMPELGKNPTPEALKTIALSNLKNLKEYGFFTQFEAGKHAVTFKTPTNVRSVLFKNQITMEFILPFAAPINVKNAPLKYRIFDPSYYVDMLHDSAKYVHVESATNPACTSTLTQPTPHFTSTNLAASLDKDATAPLNLGKEFAQTITVQCP